MRVANSVYLVGDERLLTRKDLINDARHVRGLFKMEGEDDLLLFFIFLPSVVLLWSRIRNLVKADRK